MFKLDHLEISGFKSFVDPVSVKFTGSLNAIVGPNGCGKSNVSDAVTWVLGERSAKTLRATRMEDVIFNGSQSRKPLGMAEVTLTLLTDPTMPEAEEGKLTIGRRLFRSGDSQYMINGRTVRLKEIRDLLMGTGLGLRAYSVIEQGRIDAILSGKPQERRRLLEEAAGITKYKERKRLAELKLEEARANLSRIDDIVSEVERSLRSLKRQAGAAQRYGARKAEHDAVHEKLLLKRWHAVRTTLEEIRGRLAALTGTETELVARLHHSEADQESGRESVDELAEVYAGLRRREAELIATIEGKQEFLKGARDLVREIGERLESGEGLAAHRAGEIERLVESRRSFEEVRASTSSETETAAQAVGETDSALERAGAAVGEAEKRQESLRAELLASIGEVNGLRNRLHQLDVESEKGSYRSSHLGGELEQRRTAREAAERSAETGRETLSAGRREVEDLEATQAEAGQALSRSKGRLEALEEEVVETRHDLTALAQRRELLAELAQAHEEKRSRIAAALREAGQGEASFLGDSVRIPEGWERSVDLYLAEMAEAVVLPAGGDALAVGRVLASGRGVSRVLLPFSDESASSDPTRAPAGSIDDASIVSSLAAALELPPALASCLPAAYLVEAPADALRLARANPGVAFLSRDRLWAQSGVVHIQGEHAEPGALARERELERLGVKAAALSGELERLEGERDGENAERERLAAEHEAASAGLDEARRTLAVSEARQQDLDATLRRLSIECETLASEREEIGRELGRVGESVAEVRRRLELAEGRHGELEELHDAAQRAVDQSRAEREELRTSGASRRGQLDLLRERLEAHQRGLERVEAELDGHRRQLERWVEEKAGLERRRADLGERMAAAETELQEALEKRAGSEKELREREEALREARGAQLDLEQHVRAHRTRLEEVRDQLGELRVREAGSRQDAEHLKADFREHFDRELPESFAVPEESLEELEVDLERMRALLQRMGPINELAAEEYREHEERHGFLTSQRADVVASVERLRQTIREINETSSERFLATFDEVNRSLGVTFRELFNGGEAEMRLMDEEDLLESGIEIVARPPGKRLQNLMLLSGGEKALTALALLFALFRTKPSPFCILDEVDAPLDDVNTLRFVHLLKNMASDTQFVVITHNKLTMAAASALYGVTMEERGVSRVVSVELDEIHPVREKDREEAASA